MLHLSIYPIEFRYSYRNLLFVLSFLILTLLPDVIARYYADCPIRMEGLFTLGCLAFALLLSMTNRFLIYTVLGVVFFIETTEACFTFYFGDSIKPEDIINIIRESKDVFDLSYVRHVWPAVLATVCGLGGCLYWSGHKRMRVPFVWILILYMAAHKPYRAWSHTKALWYFQPTITRPMFRNAISTFSYFAFRYLPEGYEQHAVSYQPYGVSQHQSQTENILLIFGESLYARHLPMFGYDRQTMPNLSARFENDKNWQIRLAQSGGIATATSTLLFFNTLREPANLTEIRQGTASLFERAKAAGFKTYYFSNQESRLTMGLHANKIDRIETNDSNTLFFSRYKDEGLIRLLKEVDLSHGRNFIVLHMRSPHSPYENRYKGRESEFEKFTPATQSTDRMEYTTNTYDNALLYTEMVIDRMIDTFEQMANGRKYSIYMTADHGQLFNYDGHWGHNNLILEQGTVPFFYKSYAPQSIPNRTVSHYEIGKLILNDLGWSLNNPNEDDRPTFYLHGNNIDYPYDFIEYTFDSNGKPIPIATHNTADM